MDKFIGLATGCANGLQMLALWQHCFGDSDCNGDALWYAARMHGFCTGCCGVRTSLQHVGCNCDSTLLRNVDAVVVRSVSNSAYIVFRDCISNVVASVHHCACRLRCKGFATSVAMLLSSAASAKQYGCGSFALLILCNADMCDTDVRRKQRIAGGCVSHDALIVVGGEIPEHARTCFNEYLQCAYATASGGGGYSVGIAHTPDGKCADTLSFPNFKAAASQEIHRTFLVNTNRANITNGNVGSRLGATEWTVRLLRFVLTYRNSETRFTRSPSYLPNFGNFGSRADNTSDSQQTLRKLSENRLPDVAEGSRKSFGMKLVLTHRLKRGSAIKACLLT